MEMFGKKVTYFEDGARSSAAAEGQSPARKTKLSAGQQQRPPQPPPRCQVEGCRVDLTGVKAYYCRHKVCAMHSKSPRVVVDGMEQRFCQQCSRFHQLHEFDQGKRSCRRRLAGHNERRRKLPPPPLTTRFSPFQSLPENSGGLRGYFMDFPHPGPSSREVLPISRLGGVLDQLGGYNPWHGCSDTLPVPLVYTQGPAGAPQFSSPPGVSCGECLAEDSDSSCALSLLSMQPQNTTPIRCHHCRAPAMPSAANYFSVDNPYELRVHGVGGCSHRMQGSEEDAIVGGGHFSGELELALQGGKGERPSTASAGRHGSRSYEHGHGFNWHL